MKRPRTADGQMFMFREAARGQNPDGEPLILDYFAGGGGASHGIEMAVGRSPHIAINHCEHALEVHQLNHPKTKHVKADVWDVDPDLHIPAGPVSFAWFSPDCRHFSRAKGKTPVSRKIRGLAWVAVKVAGLRKPDVIFLENVQEFRTWGPVRNDRPVKSKAGTHFRKFLRQLEALGYVIEHRVLDAADYGAPTHRRRLVLIARRDGKPICWPEPTHGPGREHPYRTAAECIDWSRPVPSIFARKKPLAEKTLRRIAAGIRRFVIEAAQPFVIRTDMHRSNASCTYDAAEPLRTITSCGGFAVVAPSLVRTAHGDQGKNGSKRWGKGEHAIEHPIPTITSSNDFALCTPVLVQINHGRDENRSCAVDAPVPTLTGKRGTGVVAPYLVPLNSEDGHAHPRTRGVCEPAPTVIASSAKQCLVAPFLTPVRTHGGGGNGPCSAELPLRTITTTKRGEFAVVVPSLVTIGHGERKTQEPRARDPHRPLATITEKNGHAALVAAFLAKHNRGATGQPATEPVDTLVSRNNKSVVAAHLTRYYGESVGSSPAAPMQTLAGCNHTGIVAAHLTKFYGTSTGALCTVPLPTITGQGGHAGLVAALLIKYYGQGSAQSLGEPLHTVVTKARFGLVTVTIDGEDYVIADIGLRMLEPEELALCQGFPPSYQLTGTKEQKTARIGNSVPPQLAAAVVRANVSKPAPKPEPAPRRTKRRIPEAAE